MLLADGATRRLAVPVPAAPSVANGTFGACAVL